MEKGAWEEGVVLEYALRRLKMQKEASAVVVLWDRAEAVAGRRRGEEEKEWGEDAVAKERRVKDKGGSEEKAVAKVAATAVERGQLVVTRWPRWWMVEYGRAAAVVNPIAEMLVEDLRGV